jgi:beta-lactamase class A
MQELVDRLNQLCDAQPFNTHWYLRDLTSGQKAGRHDHVIVPSASTRKIAIMMTALKQVNEGTISLDDPFEIEARYQDNTSGCFQHLKPGFTFTLFDALVMTIIVSDNTCTGKVVDIVGLDDVNDLCRSIGMVGTTHRFNIPPGNLTPDHPVEANNATTAADVGLLLELILDGTKDSDAAAELGCTPELCQVGMDILSWQRLTQRLPAMLPAAANVAHKTGTGARNYNDAGIIFNGDDPKYVLTVYTDYVPKELPDGMPGSWVASTHIAALCRTCWDTLGR